MERMGTEYQIFNGKEYVSLRRFWDMEGKYKTEKAKNEELEEENKKLKEDIKEIEKSQEYRYHRCMKAERQVQHSLGGDDELIYEEGLYD